MAWSNRQQAIIWINGGLGWWRIYASLGLNTGGWNPAPYVHIQYENVFFPETRHLLSIMTTALTKLYRQIAQPARAVTIDWSAVCFQNKCLRHPLGNNYRLPCILLWWRYIHPYYSQIQHRRNPFMLRLTMMRSSNGNIFRVTDHFLGEFTGNRRIPHTKASDAELWCFHWSEPESTVE